MAIPGEKAVLYAFWASSCSWRVRAALVAKQLPYEERTIDIVKQNEQKTDSYRAICPSQKVPALVIANEVKKKWAIDIVKQKEQRSDSYRAICPFADGPYRFGHGPPVTEGGFDPASSAIAAGALTCRPPDHGGTRRIFSNGVTLVESMAILQYLEDTRPQPSLAPATPLLRARMREIIETVVAGIQPLQNFGLRGSFENETQYVQFTRNWTMRGLETLEELLSRTKRDRMYCVGDQLTYADLCLVPQVYNAVGRHKINIDEYPTVAKLYAELLKEDVFATTHPEKIKSGTQ